MLDVTTAFTKPLNFTMPITPHYSRIRAEARITTLRSEKFRQLHSGLILRDSIESTQLTECTSVDGPTPKRIGTKVPAKEETMRNAETLLGTTEAAVQSSAASP